jgi:hypothetical protein
MLLCPEPRSAERDAQRRLPLTQRGSLDEDYWQQRSSVVVRVEALRTTLKCYGSIASICLYEFRDDCAAERAKSVIGCALLIWPQSYLGLHWAFRRHAPARSVSSPCPFRLRR